MYYQALHGGSNQIKRATELIRDRTATHSNNSLFDDGSSVEIYLAPVKRLVLPYIRYLLGKWSTRLYAAYHQWNSFVHVHHSGRRYTITMAEAACLVLGGIPP